MPDELTVNLTRISVNGRMVPVKTTGGYKPTARTPRTGHGAPIYINAHTFSEGTVLRFRLAQPLNV